jgi:hypothetical protein
MGWRSVVWVVIQQAEEIREDTIDRDAGEGQKAVDTHQLRGHLRDV